MKQHTSEIIPLPLKIVNCTRMDRKPHEYLVKTFSQLEKDRPDLSEKVLDLYNSRTNKDKLNVHVCGLCFQGECEYISFFSNHLREHIACRREDEESVQMVKVISYPGGETRLPV